MKQIRNIFTLIVVAASFLAFGPSSIAYAQAMKFTVAGGGGIKTSTYSAMLADLAGVCSNDDMAISEVSTNGGVKNLELLRANKVMAAIVPTSVLASAKLENSTSVANIRTLAALHQEEVHLIVMAGSKNEGGVSFGKFNIGGDKIVYNNPEDLKGRNVGAVGGSVVDARIISSLLRLGYNTVPFDSNEKLISALTKGQIDAAVVVAGAQSKVVEALPNGHFKFMPLRPNQELSTVYSPTKIQYPNISEGKAVDTLATRALLVTRVFRSDEMLGKLSELRSCIIHNVPKLQDKEGTHPKWQDVSTAERGKWEYYELPTATASAQDAPAAIHTSTRVKKSK